MHLHHPTQTLLGLDMANPFRPWIVVFLDPPEPAPDAPWRNRLLARLLRRLRPGFRHVLALSPEGMAGDWLVVNPGGLGLAIGITRGAPALPALRRLLAAGQAHAVVVTARPGPVWRLRGLFTCVTVIAHLTGMPAGPLTTPAAFHKRLLANGGHVTGFA